ncbi:hypothetical protein B0H14DRAFT_1130121 [Mycena olivaceomarginata]|nr:hypothetical protein B0H14DRAFT_1130121 [Mycena olivaceomarginata]
MMRTPALPPVPVFHDRNFSQAQMVHRYNPRCDEHVRRAEEKPLPRIPDLTAVCAVRISGERWEHGEGYIFGLSSVGRTCQSVAGFRRAALEAWRSQAKVETREDAWPSPVMIVGTCSCASAAPLRGHQKSRPATAPPQPLLPPPQSVTAAASPTVAALAASASVAAFASSQDAANTVFAESPDRPAFLGEVRSLESKIQGELDAGENDAAAADDATLEAFDAPVNGFFFIYVVLM